MMSIKLRKSIVAKIMDTCVYDIALKTPLERATYLSKKFKNNIFIKRDDLQPVFSFKLRGPYAKIKKLKDTKKIRKVIAASAGNHAQGVAMSSLKLGIEAIIVMPKTTPLIKIDAVKALKAKVILEGDSYDDAYDYALLRSRQEKLEFIHPYDDEDVIAGQGTMAMEILDQMEKKPDYVFVPVGGGGLLAGIVTYFSAYSPKTKIIAVEPEDSDCYYQAFTKNKRVTLSNVGIFADGVAVKQIGKLPFELTKNHVSSSLLVSTDEICASIKDLYDETRTIAEPAGALSLAGIKKFLITHGLNKKNIVCIFCGANMNFDRLRHVSERADLGEMNEMLVGVEIPEVAGSFKKFCSIIGKRSITEFNYRYANSNLAQVFAGIKLSDGKKEQKSVLKRLRDHGYKVKDFTNNEMAKLHIRYMVGGSSNSVHNELVFRFIFPEKPGELLNFLNTIGSSWNISLFHYRNHGADFGRVLIGFQVDKSEHKKLLKHLQSINYDFYEESANIAYKLFLK